MNRRAGFTLIELVTVLMIVAVLLAAATVGVRAAFRNANLSSGTYDLALQVQGLRGYAMSEGRDYLLVFTDATGSNSSACSWLNRNACARYFILAEPTSAWTLPAFDPAAPGANAAVIQRELLPKGVHLDLAAGASFVPPAPFAGAAVHDAELTTPCAGSPSCFAFRFTQRGEVRPVYAGATQPPKVGYAFVLGTDLNAATAAADHRGILVTFPGGIVKTRTF